MLLLTQFDSKPMYSDCKFKNWKQITRNFAIIHNLLFSSEPTQSNWSSASQKPAATQCKSWKLVLHQGQTSRGPNREVKLKTENRSECMLGRCKNWATAATSKSFRRTGSADQGEDLCGESCKKRKRQIHISQNLKQKSKTSYEWAYPQPNKSDRSYKSYQIDQSNQQPTL